MEPSNCYQLAIIDLTTDPRPGQEQGQEHQQQQVEDRDKELGGIWSEPTTSDLVYDMINNDKEFESFVDFYNTELEKYRVKYAATYQNTSKAEAARPLHMYKDFDAVQACMFNML